MKRIPTAILGATGLVGRQFARLLDGHPWFELRCATATARSAGHPYEGAPGLTVAGTSAAEIVNSGARLVFSALPTAAAGAVEEELRRAGRLVFSNAGAHRMDADVPLLIPEVNPEHLELARAQLATHPGFIVTNPNCVVAGLALVLKPLLPLGLEAVTVTSFQAVSGGGRRGVAAWEILGNVVPYIAGEEEKVERETRKILGKLEADRVAACPLQVHPSCSRVPVPDGHLQSVTVEFSRPATAGDVVAALAGFTAEPQRLELPTAPRRPIALLDEPDRPQPRLDAGAGGPGRAAGMAVSVGRLRPLGRRVGFFLLVHNTVRGAAGASVLNAELAVKRGLLSGGADD